MSDVGEHRVIDTTSVDLPLWLSVSNENQFHVTFFALAASGSAALTVCPTPAMPVAAKIGGIDGYGDDMSRSRRDVSVAARAQVGLVCFVGLHAPDLNLESHWVAFSFTGHVSRRTPRSGVQGK